MAKGKVKKGKTDSKTERITRKQRRAMERPSINTDPEDLDAQLRSLGLCTKNITGDGNCLFRSLSDQYYGQDGNHKLIRQEICQYLRDNEETYKFFVEDDQSFEHHVECMSQNATFGGNMELVAFAKLKRVDIKVYQPGLIYVINGVDEEEQADDDDDERQILHIAYHSWEHYDSVRNIDGPYTGPPEIKTIENKHESENDTEEKAEDQEEENLNSKEKVVRNACPEASIRKIRRLLVKYKGDPNKVIDALYELDNKSAEKEETAATETKEVDTEPGKEERLIILDEEPEKTEAVTSIDEGETNTKEDDTKEDMQTTIVDTENKETADEKPKKLSAAERKKEAKRRQKENKLMKERAKAARKAKYKQEKLETEDEKPSIENTTQQMKEMYI